MQNQNISRECQRLSLLSSLQRFTAQNLIFCQPFFSRNFDLTQILSHFFGGGVTCIMPTVFSLILFKNIIPNVLPPHIHYLHIFLNNHSSLSESQLLTKITSYNGAQQSTNVCVSPVPADSPAEAALPTSVGTEGHFSHVWIFLLRL